MYVKGVKNKTEIFSQESIAGRGVEYINAIVVNCRSKKKADLEVNFFFVIRQNFRYYHWASEETVNFLRP